MVAMKEKRALFGGALRCAGLAAAMSMGTTAMAEFVPAWNGGAPNYTFNYAGDGVGLTVFQYDLQYAPAFPAAQYAGNPGDGYVGAVAGPGFMGAYAQSYPLTTWAYAGAVVQQYFTVAQNKPGLVYWDFTNANDYAFVQVYRFGTGTIAYGATGTAGSQAVPLIAGELYIFIARASIGAPNGGNFAIAGFINGIPAPGALAVLGVGMLGVRRRRRE